MSQADPNPQLPHEAKIASYLKGLAPSGNLEEIVAEGTAGQGREAATTRLALTKVAGGKELSPEEMFSLEAIIIPDKRPAIIIRNNDYLSAHSLWTHLNEADVKQRLSAAIRSVGRVELPHHPSLPYAGTGFAVGPDLLMTNRHVAEIFTRGLGSRDLTFITGQMAGVDFLAEHENPARHFLKVAKVLMIHPYWDMALLQVEGGSAGLPWTGLSATAAGENEGREVALIGYPAFDSRSPADVQHRVFDGIYGVKRLMPGTLMRPRRILSYNHEVPALTHNGSTLGGASGSIVIDIATGHAVGLHFAGRYLDANFAVPAAELARDGRVIDAGLRFVGVPVRQPTPWDNVWRAVDAQGGEAPPPPSSPSPLNLVLPVAAAPLTFTVPLEISIDVRARLPDGAGLPGTADRALLADAAAERMQEPYRETDYGNRQGYDADFLGFHLPMPAPADPSVLAPTKDGGHVLAYHNFSITMHRARRLALVTASNLDARPAAKRPGDLPPEMYSRKGLSGLGPNDQEKWFPDLRLDAAYQLSDKFFNKDRKAFDKGHLVRREDVAWGRTYAGMRAANGDTYHITNCSPQVAGFNRSTASKADDNWGDLENLVLAQARTQRLTVFSGPVLAADDPVFIGVNDEEQVRVKIPQRYWKVVAARVEDRLHCFGFVLEQDLDDVAFEFVASPAWGPRLVPLADIEAMAGIVFTPEMRKADQAPRLAGRALRHGMAGTVREAPSQPEPFDLVLTDLPLSDYRREQDAGGNGEGIRFALRYPVCVRASGLADIVAEALAERLGLRVEVAPLFAADAELDRHLLLTIPGVTPPDRADLFDLARFILAPSEAETVEPDLGSDLFQADGTVPGDGSPESADWAFWCWAGDEDKPADRDWALAKTKVREAWARSVQMGRPARGKGILVFQPDTGVIAHPALPPNAHLHPAAANLVEGGIGPIDPMTGSGNLGHGTGTGSVVASPDGADMQGVAPDCTLVPIRCIRSVAVFDQSRVAQAIDHARRNGAHVITMSLGGVFSSALHDAVRKAVDADIIVVAAAGNCVGEVVWPARYEEVIAVGGVNSLDQPWRGSSKGGAVDIAGPAEFVLRADARLGTVSGGQGTSFATANLAGLAALWLAHHGRDKLLAILPEGVRLQHVFRALLRKTARVPEGFDTSELGVGIVDADALLAADPKSVLGILAVLSPSPTNTIRQVGELLSGLVGDTGLEAVGPALTNPMQAMELAAVVLDRLRARRTVRAAVEALPPVAVSAGLRDSLGSEGVALMRRAVGDGE